MSFVDADRPVASLASDLSGIGSRCERLGDIFSGLTVLFAVVTALVAGLGLWFAEPLFAMSAAFALVAAVAFGFSAFEIASARRALPRIQPAVIREEARRRRPEAWRKAA